MNPTRQLHELGQRLWLDTISRQLLDSETLQRYIDDFSITGLTSNPSIFDTAIGAGTVYDPAIQEKTRAGKAGEELFIELALDDLCRAADLFRPLFNASHQTDGWVSMEISPLLSGDTQASIDSARRIHQQANRPNLFVKIPGTPAGIPAIEELIFAGIPINVTLLFSRQHYLAAAEAYMRGLERRLAAGLDLRVASVASLFVSRWDVAINDQVEPALRNCLGLAICQQTYQAHRQRLESPRWRALATAGAYPQRLLWASTGSKDAALSDTFYIEALAAPDTINTLPEKTLLAFAAHGRPGAVMAADGVQAEATLRRFAEAGVDIEALAQRLQQDGTAAFITAWQHLLQAIADKSASLAAPR